MKFNKCLVPLKIYLTNLDKMWRVSFEKKMKRKKRRFRYEAAFLKGGGGAHIMHSVVIRDRLGITAALLLYLNISFYTSLLSKTTEIKGKTFQETIQFTKKYMPYYKKIDASKMSSVI